MTPMTRSEWEAEWSACFRRLRAMDYDVPTAQRMALGITTARYGKQPKNLPLWVRLALNVANRKMKGKPMIQRILTSIGFALGVGLPLYAAAQVAQTPGGAEVIGSEWAGIIYTALVAGYANYKSNTTKIMPNRTEWTPEQRTVEVAKMDASALVSEAKVVAAEKVAEAKEFAALNKSPLA